MRTSLWIVLLTLFSFNSAHALGLNFGLKVGHEMFNSNILGSPEGAPSTFLAMGELDLSVINLEINLGSHSSFIVAPQSGKTEFVNQEFAVAAIARLSLPIVPKVLSFDIGGGLDQRILMGQYLAANEKTNAQASGSRTMLPISAQIAVNVPVVKFYLETRFNVELNNSLSFGGFAGIPDEELGANHELWILGGIAF